jgi:NADPH-dependent ferric siderophore reductase
MSSAKAVLGSIVGRFFFHDVTVTRVRDLSPRFRQVGFEGPALCREHWEPGDKVQVFLPGMGMRTYTPLAWDARKGSTELLVYLHGSSPGAEWGRTLREGMRAQFFGPRRSLVLGDRPGPVVLFGDETSFGVAQALKGAGRDVTCVFEVSQREESAAVLRELGFDCSPVERIAGDAHLAEVQEQLRTALFDNPDASFVMTGRAQSIQSLKVRLRSEGLGTTAKVKAYWSVGKTGLD